MECAATLILFLALMLPPVFGQAREVTLASASEVPGAAPTAHDASIFNRRNARTITMNIPAPRGQIVDREGLPFAQNRVAYQLAVQYEQFQKQDRETVVAWGRARVEMAKALLPEVSEPRDNVLYEHYRHRRWLPLYISSHVSAEKAKELEPKLTRGLILQPVYQRYYPGSTLASHIIGYTGSVGKLPTGPINPNEPLWEETEGRAGFEMLYNEELTGRPATLRLIYDENGAKLQEEQRGQPLPGGTLVSTLNLRWQKRAEEVLARQAKRGALVVIDVATGEVLVMASNPSFNLNQWIPGISNKQYTALKDDPANPLFARAFQGRYPPASSFKPIVALAALNDGTITENTTVFCPAFVAYGNHKLWNWSRSEYGDLAVNAALKWSNNPWFARVGNRVGSSSFLGLARRLGYGTKTGLPLVGEDAGLIPTADYVRRSLGRPITEGDVANWSIGQGSVLSTPLQVAQAMAGIANGGALPKLHLMMQVQDGHGRVVKTAQPERRHWLGVDAKAVKIVRKGMRDVVRGGTGRSSALGWTEVCGKTGTGQWGPASKNQGVAWFAGFLPYDEPRLAFACLYEGRPGEKVSGSRNAGTMVPAFFNSFKDEIKDMIAPAQKALVVMDEVQEQEASKGVLRAIPVDPLTTEDDLAPGGDEEVPQALPLDATDLVEPSPGGSEAP